MISFKQIIALLLCIGITNFIFSQQRIGGEKNSLLMCKINKDDRLFSSKSLNSDENHATQLNLANESPHTAWLGLGVGGSVIGGFPLSIGYSYDFSERVAFIGSYSWTTFAQKGFLNGNPIEYSTTYSNLGFGVRLYTKESKRKNEKIIPFADLTLNSFKDDDGKSQLIPGLSFGCRIKFESHHGILTKMNLSPVSLLDIAYSYNF